MSKDAVIAGLGVDNQEDKPVPCTRCNFDDEFITDYETDGKEFQFCGNCGQRVEGKKGL